MSNNCILLLLFIVLFNQNNIHSHLSIYPYIIHYLFTIGFYENELDLNSLLNIVSESIQAKFDLPIVSSTVESLRVFRSTHDVSRCQDICWRSHIN